MNKNRQRRHNFYYERLKRETEFKRAAQALPIDINLLTKGKLNGTTHIKRANAAETGRCIASNAKAVNTRRIQRRTRMG